MPVGVVVKQKVLDALKASATATNEDLAKTCEVSPRAIRYALKELHAEGKIRWEPKRGAHRRIAVLDPPHPPQQETVSHGPTV